MRCPALAYKRCLRFLTVALVSLAATGSPPATAAGNETEEPRLLLAAPLAGTISVDGRLEEDAWAAAEVATSFRQLEPEMGAPASRQTEVRVLYGPSALYVGAVLYDDPDQIRRPLTRRDHVGDADVFTVSLDGHGTGRTAYLFAVTAAGVQFDAILEGGSTDTSWDAVWDSAVRITPEGWVVEMAIPYSMLRFNEAAEQTWWVQFQRTISRNNEQAFWQPVTRQELGVGFIAGRLEGLEGLSPRRNIQVRPYTLSRLTRAPDGNIGPTYLSDTGVDAGVDVKLGLGRNVFLDVAFNPDFGQVEADPAVLNLTAYETFFPEQRPFFLEGSSIFDYGFAPGDGPILYTRRIGGLGRIVGAGKLTGRTRGGTSFGVLAASTSDGFVMGEDGPIYTGDDFQPDLVYTAGRVKREFGDRSFVGAAATYFDGFGSDFSGDHYRALVGGVDWDVRAQEGIYRWDGAFTGSHRRFGEQIGSDPRTGFALYTGLDKLRGVVTGGVGLRVYSDRFEPNDLGYFLENDVIRTRGAVSLLFNDGEPFGPFRQARGTLYGQQSWTYRDRVNVGGTVQLRTDLFLKNFHRIGLRTNFADLGGVDVRESRGLGPVARVPGIGFSGDYTTDTRRRFLFYPSASMGLYRDGASAWSVRMGSSWTASDRLALSWASRYERRDNVRSWVANERFRRHDDGFSIRFFDPGLQQARFVPLDAPLDAALEGLAPLPDVPTDYFVAVFGARDQRSLDTSVRATYTFQPNLSLQLYTQLFAARFRFDDFRLLAGPDDLRPLQGYPGRRDEARRSLLSNAVLRWEYRPGSTVYVVWGHNRLGFDGGYHLFDPLLVSPFDRGTFGLAADTFDLLPTNVLLVKLNYLFLR